MARSVYGMSHYAMVGIYRELYGHAVGGHIVSMANQLKEVYGIGVFEATMALDNTLRTVNSGMVRQVGYGIKAAYNISQHTMFSILQSHGWSP